MLYLLRMEAYMSFQIFLYCIVHGLEFRIFPLRLVVTQGKRSYSPYYLKHFFVGKRDGFKFFFQEHLCESKCNRARDLNSALQFNFLYILPLHHPLQITLQYILLYTILYYITQYVCVKRKR